jgi:hypothetical protein
MQLDKQDVVDLLREELRTGVSAPTPGDLLSWLPRRGD